MDFGLKRDNPNETLAEIINEGAFYLFYRYLFWY